MHPPWTVPLHLQQAPSSSTPAFSHFWMRRTTRRSATRCSTKRMSHSVVHRVKERTDVRIEYPVHLLRLDADRERIQRLVGAAPRSKAIGEAEEVLLVDGVQHLDDRALDDLVFQRGNAERPLPPVRLRDIRSPRRLRSIGAPLDAGGQVREVALQRLP